jgi:hypothetical protein
MVVGVKAGHTPLSTRRICARMAVWLLPALLCAALHPLDAVAEGAVPSFLTGDMRAPWYVIAAARGWSLGSPMPCG